MDTFLYKKNYLGQMACDGFLHEDSLCWECGGCGCYESSFHAGFDDGVHSEPYSYSLQSAVSLRFPLLADFHTCSTCIESRTLKELGEAWQQQLVQVLWLSLSSQLSWLGWFLQRGIDSCTCTPESRKKWFLQVRKVKCQGVKVKFERLASVYHDLHQE